MKERTCAVQPSPASGVARSIAVRTLEAAICCDRNGTPSVLTLNASIDMTRADTARFTAPPSKPVQRPQRREVQPAPDPAAQRGSGGVAHQDQHHHGGDHRGQPPAFVRHPAGNQRDGEERGHSAGDEADDAAKRHYQTVPQACDEVKQQRQQQNDVQQRRIRAQTAPSRV